MENWKIIIRACFHFFQIEFDILGYSISLQEIVVFNVLAGILLFFLFKFLK